MKILYAITKSNWGGAQKYVFDLAVGAKKAGHDTSVILGGNGPLAQKLEASDIRVISLAELGRDISPLADVRSIIEFTQIIKREKPDVLHINSSKIGIIGALTGRIVGVPKIVFTAHGWAFNESRPPFARYVIICISWLTIALSHKAICVSEGIYKKAPWPFVRQKLIVIKNGIDAFAPQSRGTARSSLIPNVKDGAIIIGTIAELHKSKGLDILLRAFAETSAKAELVIIGDGDERSYLENLAQELSLTRVHFLGFVPDAYMHLSGFDIFALPSRSEALGYVLLEAGIARLPVVASNVGGIPEIIRHEKTGLLVPPENAAELAKSLDMLSGSGFLREKYGENLHTFVLEQFSKERMIDATLEAYEK